MKNYYNDKKQYSAADIQRYLNGQMPAHEMHSLEKAALDDPFLSDAIEGYGEINELNKGKVMEDIGELYDRLKSRTEPYEKLVPLRRTNWWKIAAAILILAGTGTVVYTLVNNQPRKSSVAKTETIEPRKSSADSFSASKITRSESTATANTNSNSPKPSKDFQTVKSPSAKIAEEDTQALAFESKPATVSPKAKQQSADLINKNEEKKDSAPLSMQEEITDKTARAENNAPTMRKPAPVNHFSGKVVDKENKPVADASILVANNQLGVLTDSNGYFNFTLPDSVALVAIQSPGFKTANTTLRTRQSNKEIKLSESLALNEVAVVRTSSEKKRSVPLKDQLLKWETEPVIGWEEYEKYIEKNKKITAEQNNLHGDVTVSFFVSTSGRPEKLSIEKSLIKSFDEEAIRLVKEGPSWKLTKDPKIKTTIIIRF